MLRHGYGWLVDGGMSKEILGILSSSSMAGIFLLERGGHQILKSPNPTLFPFKTASMTKL